MPITDYPIVQNLINGGYKFKFANYLEEGFSLFKKQIGMYIAFMLLLFSSMFVASGFIALVGFNLYLIIPFVIILGFLIQLFVAGFYIFTDKIRKNENPQFSDFFGGFEFAQPIVLRLIATIMISIIANLPYYYYQWDAGYLDWFRAVMENPGDVEILADQPQISPIAYLLQIPAYYFSVAYIWADFFIIFKGMEFWDAMESSRRIITKKWFIFFAFSIIVGLITAAGIFGFCIGIIFTAPAAMCMVYASFEDIVGTDDGIGKDDLMEHLIS